MTDRHRNAEARHIAWRRHGLLVIDPADVADDWLRAALVNHGNKHYGQRGR